MTESTSTDLDLQLVRYFAAVADHRHFGRAAAALHIAQPSLSRQIQSLEQQLGARLLDRTPQGAQLTEAGEVFLPHAKALLRASAQATARTKAAAKPSQITIGHVMNVIISPAVRELRRQHPDADVRTLHLSWDEPREALLERRVDVAITRLPLATDQLHATILYDEPRVLLVARDHRLADKESVSLDDIVDEPLVRSSDAAWNAYWRVDPRPDGSRAPDGPLVHNPEDKIELVAAGLAVAIIPFIPGIAGLRPELAMVALRDVEPSNVVVVTRADDRNRLVAAFRKYAQAHIKGPGSV